ncbi:MAG: zinc ribbon domain-containing protein [Bacillota bacterium]|nr:zinc ribbon domain-containing protein [Bacillota bacterium]
MPLYEFRCTKCGAQFEELCSAEARPGCPKCGATEVKRLFSAFATKSGGEFRSSTQGGGSCAGCAGGSCASCH